MAWFFTPQRAQRWGSWLGEKLYRAETSRAAAYARSVPGATRRAAGRAATGAGYAMAGVGGLAALGAAGAVYGAGGAIYEARNESARWKRSQEAGHMTRVLSTMQVGPFGALGRPYGMSSNYGNSAGMSLAMHYSRQGTGMKDPFFSMAGHFVEAGRFLGG